MCSNGRSRMAVSVAFEAILLFRAAQYEMAKFVVNEWFQSPSRRFFYLGTHCSSVRWSLVPRKRFSRLRGDSFI